MQRKLSLKPSILWVGGDAFVQIVSARLAGTKTNLHVEVRVINKHIATLTKVEYEVVFYDSTEVRLNEDPYIVTGENINVKPDTIGLASKLNVSELYPATRRVELKLLKAYFDDDNSLELIYENMEKYVDEELEVDFIELLRKVAGQDAYSLSALLMYNWRCVCGFFNGNTVEKCSNCGRGKNQVVEDYSSMSRMISEVEKEIQGEYEEFEKNSEQFEDDDIDDVTEQTQKEVEESPKDEAKGNSWIDFIKGLTNRYPKVALGLFFSSGVLTCATIYLWISSILL